MSKEKFTDGPWFKKGRKVFWQKPERDLPKDNLFNGLVCTCATTEDNPPEVIEEANANATLIAAAPDLYNTLNNLVECGAIPNGAYVAKVKEILKKARGEKP